MTKNRINFIAIYFNKKLRNFDKKLIWLYVKVTHGESIYGTVRADTLIMPNHIYWIIDRVF